MRSVRASLAVSFSERYALIALSLAGNILIARLLSPEQIGTYSVAVAVIGLAQVIREFGVGSYLIQERDLTEAHVRTAFGISMLLGSAMFLATMGAAPAIGQYYNNGAIVATLRFAGLNFLILPFCMISLALLRREMEFGKLMAVNITAAAAGFLITITLAYAGFGPDALAIGTVGNNIVTGVGAWVARGAKRPLPPSLSEWRRVTNFGGQSAAMSIVTAVAMDVNDLFIGKILGFGPVAMISRAQGLANLYNRDLMSAVRNVMFPTFARRHREGRTLEADHTYAVSAVTVLGWPFYGFASIYSLEILRLLFGDQWDAAAPLVRWFCLAGAFSATCNLILPLLTAIGRIDLVTRAELVIQPIRALMLIAVIFYFRSIEAFAVASAFLAAVITPALYIVKRQAVPTEWTALLPALIASGKVTLATLLPALLVVGTTRHMGNAAPGLAMMFIACVASAFAWGVSLRVFDHPVSRDPIVRGLVSRVPILKGFWV